MVILRFKIRSKPDKSDEVMAALDEIITPARATEGVSNFDIAGVLLEPDSFIATAIYEDGAALERQESAPEVHKAMALFAESLAAPPERTIYDASVDPTSSKCDGAASPCTSVPLTAGSCRSKPPGCRGPLWTKSGGLH
jgi:quinol monooxygenase YgiN